MTEAINAHKKMAMGKTEGNVMKKGGKVKGYANGGAISESSVRNLPAKGDPKKPRMASGKEKIATMKSGGKSKKSMVC
jgi:hypothetical protein